MRSNVIDFAEAKAILRPPAVMLHDWTDSWVGHGLMQCRRCLITGLEANVLGQKFCEGR